MQQGRGNRYRIKAYIVSYDLSHGYGVKYIRLSTLAALLLMSIHSYIESLTNQLLILFAKGLIAFT